MTPNVQYTSNERYLIINADDFGISHAGNQAIMQLFRNGCITSASLMMPCPAAMEAATFSKDHPEASVGIHLTLTSSERIAYSPVYRKSALRSLTTENGNFPHDGAHVELHADPEQVKLELNAQIQTAIAYGVDPTHLDSHGGSILGLHVGRDFLEVVFDLCEKYALPFNLPKQIVRQPFFTASQKALFQKRIDSAGKRGIVLIDAICGLPYDMEPDVTFEEARERLIEQLASLEPGITQLVAHPATAVEETRALTPHYRQRELEFRLLQDAQIQQVLRREQIRRISWKDVRALQRS